jgi:hypothetical protein
MVMDGGEFDGHLQVSIRWAALDRGTTRSKPSGMKSRSVSAQHSLHWKCRSSRYLYCTIVAVEYHAVVVRQGQSRAMRS